MKKGQHRRTVIELPGPKSEEARNNEANGVETDPILAKIAKSRGINLQKLLKTLKNRPHELTEEEQKNIIEFSSAILPKSMERKMIEMHRNDRDHLNYLLFNHNARAATKMATVYNNKYARTALNRRYVKEDFLSAARYGLWQGARRFDLDRMYNGEPVKFITFATPWMFRYISEMLYEKENMIVHQSLDAKAYGGESNMTLGDIIAAEDGEGGEPMEVNDSGTNEDDDDEGKAMLGVPRESDDEENMGFEENHMNDTLLQSLEGESLNTITGPLDDVDPELATKAQVDANIKAVKDMMLAPKPQWSRDDGTPESGEMTAPMEPAVSDRATLAIEMLCTEILNIKDPQERTITLFIGRKFIQTIVKKAAGKELPSSILNVHSMLKGVPGNKKKLLMCLGLTSKEFDKLCTHYACKYMNRGA